jgi:hypothetical protein
MTGLFRLVILLVGLAGVVVGAAAATTSFDGGQLTVSWGTTENGVLVTARMLEPAAEELQDSATWVLTAYAGRFEDGIYAWQLHFSQSSANVLVIPSDFLTARVFTLAQLGIEIREHVSGKSISLWIPSDGPVPHLIAPQDKITLHALWLRQTPLATLVVEEPAVALAAGGGGGAEVVPAALSSSFLPLRTEYVRGETVEHRFIIADPALAEEGWGAASYSLLRIREGQGDEFVRFSHLDYDETSGVYSYRIETDRLPPGRYRLIVWVERVGRTEDVILTLSG